MGQHNSLCSGTKGIVYEGQRSNLYAPNNIAAKHIKLFFKGWKCEGHLMKINDNIKLSFTMF